MMCQCRLIICNEGTTLVGDVENGGCFVCVCVHPAGVGGEQVIDGDSLYFLPIVSVNQKLL